MSRCPSCLASALVADEPASLIGSPPDPPDSSELIVTRRISTLFANLDSSTTSTPT